jgi:hypothetical protein
MLNRVNRIVKQRLNTLSIWHEALREAKSQLESIENRAFSLKELIENWSRRKSAG